MKDKYYIIWEVDKVNKHVTFHRLIKEKELEQALKDVAEVATGEVRYIAVDEDANPPDTFYV